ncbi:hypothetical protein [Oceaniglobus roseus]|uniref:hypothetical protein n=1 Tax=Oceaniglobus roseus TaxID=1737570 RepID=UPI000C7F3144|nr:hypothetical protein [Kandeliimicrobium roseum]
MPVYMKIGDIDGESRDSAHKQWTVIQSLGDSARTVLDHDHKDWCDIATMGQAVDEDGDRFVFFGIDLDGDGRVDGTLSAEIGTARDGQVPLEDLSLNFEKIDWTYSDGGWNAGDVMSFTEVEWT